MSEGMPTWLAKLAKEKGADSAWKVMDHKRISDSDVSFQQNRFLFDKQVIEEKVMPMMNTEEIEAANLACSVRPIGGEEGQPVAGMKRRRGYNEGLQVTVYNKSGPECLLYLTRWDSIAASVLRGPNYKELRSYFTVGDLVEMWAFRDGAGKLCFVIEQDIDLNRPL